MLTRFLFSYSTYINFKQLKCKLSLKFDLNRCHSPTCNTLFICANNSNDNNMANLSSLQSIHLEIEILVKFM